MKIRMKCICGFEMEIEDKKDQTSVTGYGSSSFRLDEFINQFKDNHSTCVYNFQANQKPTPPSENKT